MGDYKIGYVERPDIPLSHVMAASAGFPVLIGPYCLSTSGYKWNPSRYSNTDYSAPDKIIHLWDGGVYDNLGLESIFTPENAGTLKDGLDYMIVSNASASIGPYRRHAGFAYSNLKRFVGYFYGSSYILAEPHGDGFHYANQPGNVLENR